MYIDAKEDHAVNGVMKSDQANLSLSLFYTAHNTLLEPAYIPHILQAPVAKIEVGGVNTTKLADHVTFVARFPRAFHPFTTRIGFHIQNIGRSNANVCVSC